MKIGILGAGGIANSVAPAIVATEKAECWAVASRDLKKAQAFAEKFGFQHAYGSYKQLVEDPEIQLIYIATPHSHHYEHMKLCLEHGKNVLCEKAFTENIDQARKIAALAKEKNLFAAEAIWTRYMPSRKIINDVLSSGIIGTPNTLTANLSYPISQVPRIRQPELAGGALLDIGVYGINFALMHFGWDLEQIGSAVSLTETGVDGMETMTFFYKDGRMAVLTHSIYARSDRKGIIHGDKGYMVVENINNPQSVSVYDIWDRPVAHYDVPKQVNGYEYEFAECIDCIENGEKQARSMPMEETLHVMELMDGLRKKWGVIPSGRA